MNRRDFLRTLAATGACSLLPVELSAADLGFRLVDVTAPAGLSGFRHNSGAYGAKLLPETLGSGCAFIDYDADGWQDILLINSADWPGHKRTRSTPRLYRNNRNGTFTDVTRAAGLDVEMYGMGVAVGDYNNDGFPDIFITCVGQSRLFRNTGKGKFVEVTQAAGLAPRQGFSTSAMWVDYDRDGLLDLFVCNYVRWSARQDVFCSADGKTKSFCTPEAYRGETCWLFRNRGNGTFEDVTATSGIFDTSSKSLGVALIDYGRDGWPDLLVANDTQANKLYVNQRNGKFKEAAVEAGLAFSNEGKARAGMGIDVADLDNNGRAAVAVSNFDNEMVGLFKASEKNLYADAAMQSGVGAVSRNTLGFGLAFADMDLDGRLDLIVVNGHIDDTVRNIRRESRYAQPPHLFLNEAGKFRDVAAQLGPGFAQPRVARGLAYGDFDRDGDHDLLITTNNGPAVLLRNDQQAGNLSIRFYLQGTKSNRDGIGARVRLTAGGVTQERVVKSGSSYLSQSELPVTFGLGKRDQVERVTVDWPSGRIEEFTRLAAGRGYRCVEGKGVEPLDGF